MSATANFFDQLLTHFKGVTLAIVGLFLLGLVGAYVSNHLNAKSQEGRNAFYLAEKDFEKESKALSGPIPDPIAGQNEKAVKVKGAAAQEMKDTNAKNANAAKDADLAYFKKLNTDTQFGETVKSLKKIDENFGGTRAAFDSRIRLGDLYLNHGEAEKALPWYEKAVHSAPDSFDKALAFSGLGYAQENLGKYPEAILSYQKGINLGESSVKGDLLLGIARCYEVLHDSANARKLYDQILKELPNTDYSKTAEIYQGQL